jgi:hypothetical protein
MKTKIQNFLLGVILFSLTSCETKTQSKNKNLTKIKVSKTSKLITKGKYQVDIPVNDSLTKILKPIRENFRRLNSIEYGNWSSVVTKEMERTTEGGEVTFYHWNADLDKIVTKEYGETFQVSTEYYFLNGNISFVFQKTFKYNRPIYQDSSVMKEMNDNEVFNLSKSKITEERFYFENEKLILQLSSKNNLPPLTVEYLKEEQKRILTKLNRILKLENAK